MLIVNCSSYDAELNAMHMSQFLIDCTDGINKLKLLSLNWIPRIRKDLYLVIVE